MDKLLEKILPLAQKLQRYFPKFYLAGGTAIMIKHKHRPSFDLDFFSYTYFSFQKIATKLHSLFKIEKIVFGIDNFDTFISVV